MIAIARKNLKPAKEERDYPTPSEPQGRAQPVEGEHACLHDLFEAQVSSTPNADALVYDGERLSYLELNSRANRLAHRLRALGVGRETLVGILLERSANMVIAILGVLKAGGAYLPLDPAYASDRLAFLLKDAQPHTTLTQSSLLARLRRLGAEDGSPAHTICLDADEGAALESAKNPAPSARPGDLAYVIYTSGSTGQPNGVAVEHRNAVALVQWAGQVYSAHERDGVLAGISICFGPSILNLFVPLGLGGKVILAPHTLALPGLAAANEVRLINTVPSVMRELLRIGGIPTSVETVNLSGEPLSIQLVQELYALPHVKRVYDLYGPAEAATCSSFVLRTPGGRASIGRPIAGTQVYLLDERFQPVPAGATGELFIGGAGVARGYLNRPRMTEEKFVLLPFPAGRRVRLYRTGDLCRCQLDGNLEFVGRIDEMVKIGGFRVEPGEIESVLLTHPAVRETVVVGHEEAAGERRLVAYVVPRAALEWEKEETAEVAECRIVPQLEEHLRARLPDHMLPGAFVVLDRFELMPSGKIDRSALPAPVRTGNWAGDYLAPRTSAEELICRIWADLLGFKQIGVNDDFFELGGDSLLGAALLAEVENRAGLKLRSEAVLRTTTVAQLATILDELRAKSCLDAIPSRATTSP